MNTALIRAIITPVIQLVFCLHTVLPSWVDLSVVNMSYRRAFSPVVVDFRIASYFSRLQVLGESLGRSMRTHISKGYSNGGVPV